MKTHLLQVRAVQFSRSCGEQIVPCELFAALWERSRRIQVASNISGTCIMLMVDGKSAGMVEDQQ